MEFQTEKKPNTVIFAVMVALFWMSLYTYQPILSPHSYSLGASTMLVGSILSAYGFTQMFCRVPLGLLSDSLGKRKIFVILGCVVTVIAALGMGLTSDPVIFMIFRGISGVAASAWVSFTVLFSSYFDPNDAPRAMAKVMLFSQTGRMLSMVVGGFVAERMGDTASFMVAAGVGLASVVAALFITENAPPVKKKARISEQLAVGLDKTLLLVSMLALLMMIIQWGATVGFTSQYGVTIGCTPGQLGLLSAISESGMICASLLNTRLLLNKWGVRTSILVGMLLNALATVFIPIFALNTPTLFTLQFFVGLGNGLCFPLLMGLSIQNIPAEKRGVAMGFYQSIYALGMFVGPLLTGMLINAFSLRISLGLIGSTGFITCTLAALLLKKPKPAKAG